MAKMKHPNGQWRTKVTGGDDTPAHPYANKVPDNATRKAHTSARHTTRHGTMGQTAEGRATCGDCGPQAN